ncbi:MAG: hypothetical protein DRH51_03210 [Candidatus Coatesbacteria bacterium]|nr:MAG: hypothetical protein DRH51_03210 [Candidatus Coatesbacteria bacterium]RLC41748.1 MAG: hypothetical protein DRH49_04895 [Candidatus Coatesbacteria bacterium]RLC43983.1 MAG: hypothetical protein DRH44_03765 [Candidatus Coatesbacteria bacterium]
MGSKRQEKRRFKRVKARLRGGVVQSRKSDKKSALRTVDISQGGIYCDTSHYIEPYTIVHVHLILEKGKRTKGKQKEIECDGIVVRTERKGKPTREFSHSVAIYFLDISDEDRELIGEIVNESGAEE